MGEEKYLDFQIEDNGIYNADCLFNYDQCGFHSVDLILTDLPYGTTACKWDSILPFDKLWEMVEYVLKPNGIFITTARQPFTSALIMSNPKMFKYTWIWEKDKASNIFSVKYAPLEITEDVLVFSKCGINTGAKNPIKYNTQGLIEINNTVKNSNSAAGMVGDAHKTTIKRGGEYKQQYTNYPKQIIKFSKDKKGIHSTQKPVALMEYLLLTYSDKGDFIYDPCAGSGTTAIACENLQRDYICFEKDTEIYEKAKSRLDAHSKLGYRPKAGGIFSFLD